MSTNFPNTFVETVRPISTDIGVSGNAAFSELGKRGFTVVTGLTPAIPGLIRTIAQDPRIREYCPRDISDSRFNEKWLAKNGGRAMFLLINGWLPDKEITQDMIAGYNWSGIEPCEELPDHPITTAYRLNPLYFRQGLARPFAQVMLSTTRTLYAPDGEGISLENWQSNVDAVKLYTQKLKFEALTKRENELRETLDIHAPDAIEKNGKFHKRDTRLFMTYPE